MAPPHTYVAYATHATISSLKQSFTASRQTLAVAARHVPDVDIVTYLLRRITATSASDRRPSAAWVLSSAGKLIPYLYGSYFLPYLSADLFLFCFYPPSLSVTRLRCSRALSSISWVDAPYCWWASLFWYSAPTQFSKALKNDIRSHYMRTAPEPPLQAGQGMVKRTPLDTVEHYKTLTANRNHFCFKELEHLVADDTTALYT